MHGLADALADDVPAGDLDRRQRRAVDLAAVGVDVAVHALGQQLDLRRIEPDVGVLELVDGVAIVSANAFAVPSPTP